MRNKEPSARRRDPLNFPSFIAELVKNGEIVQIKEAWKMLYLGRRRSSRLCRLYIDDGISTTRR